MLALLVVAPFVAYPFFVMQALCFALFACAFNLLIGYVGLLSFGHAMFLGAGELCQRARRQGVGLDPALAILAGVASSAVLGLIAGVLSIRSQGIYFAMITRRAVADDLFLLRRGAVHPRRGRHPGACRRGARSAASISPARLRRSMSSSSRCSCSAFSAIYRTINSPFGEILKAIRENEPRAVSLGYRVARYKLAAFVLSAALAGLAGADQGDRGRRTPR